MQDDKLIGKNIKVTVDDVVALNATIISIESYDDDEVEVIVETDNERQQFLVQMQNIFE